jgi:hypothetical protein
MTDMLNRDETHTYKCPTCNKDIVSLVFDSNSNSWTMNILRAATINGKLITDPPPIQCSKHNQQVTRY